MTDIKPSFDRAAAESDHVTELCDCTPGEWTARVEAGSPESGPYMSTWTCDACRPMQIKAYALFWPTDEIKVIEKKR